jgi:hypothetical protein
MKRVIVRGKNGWPVEWVRGRPVQKWVRFLIHGSIYQTWKGRDL